jgi:hypothetical protein
LFLFVFNTYIEKHLTKVHHELWGINSSLNILFNLLITIGFWKTRQGRI